LMSPPRFFSKVPFTLAFSHCVAEIITSGCVESLVSPLFEALPPPSSYDPPLGLFLRFNRSYLPVFVGSTLRVVSSCHPVRHYQLCSRFPIRFSSAFYLRAFVLTCREEKEIVKFPVVICRALLGILPWISRFTSVLSGECCIPSDPSPAFSLLCPYYIHAYLPPKKGRPRL